jgi:Rrf2 family protein
VGRLVAAKDLAAALNAKLTYFAKVLQALSHAGLIRAERGKLGGYALSRPASQITLADVLKALDDGTQVYPCPGDRGCKPPEPCAIRSAFYKASKALTDEFARITVAQVVDQLRSAHGAPQAPWLSVAAR